MLMSYQREGWVEDEPARLTGRLEVRPAAELGPIIVCLDTSGEALDRCKGSSRQAMMPTSEAQLGEALAWASMAVTVRAIPWGTACSAEFNVVPKNEPWAAQGPCTVHVKWWPRLWRSNACGVHTGSSGAVTCMRSGGWDRLACRHSPIRLGRLGLQYHLPSSAALATCRLARQFNSLLNL
jgi:hypothetical protein